MTAPHSASRLTAATAAVISRIVAGNGSLNQGKPGETDRQIKTKQDKSEKDAGSIIMIAVCTIMVWTFIKMGKHVGTFVGLKYEAPHLPKRVERGWPMSIGTWTGGPCRHPSGLFARDLGQRPIQLVSRLRNPRLNGDTETLD